MSTPSSGWDESYTGSTPAPWDIGRPQPAFVRLAEHSDEIQRLKEQIRQVALDALKPNG